jgi:hypothetical protein
MASALQLLLNIRRLSLLLQVATYMSQTQQTVLSKEDKELCDVSTR